MYRWILVLPLLFAAGCLRSEASFTDHSRNAEAYALDIKTLVLDHAAQARRSREPADQIAVIVQELEQSSSRPTGSYKETYAGLLSLAQDILQACEQSPGPPPKLAEQLRELESVAATLPGSVTIVDER